MEKKKDTGLRKRPTRKIPSSHAIKATTGKPSSVECHPSPPPSVCLFTYSIHLVFQLHDIDANSQVCFETHRKLIPANNKGRPPSYYIIGGLVFTTVYVLYLRSEYGKDYGYDAPVKLLDKLLHELPKSHDEQIIVVSQVLVADINIGHEEIVNTQHLLFVCLPGEIPATMTPSGSKKAKTICSWGEWWCY